VAWQTQSFGKYQAGMAKITGDAERDFSSGRTQQFVVTFDAPVATAIQRAETCWLGNANRRGR